MLDAMASPGERAAGAPAPLQAAAPRRSCLTVPGSSERFLAKAAAVPADELILDLEDSVAPAEKERARDLVAGVAAGTDWGGRLLAVRVNGAASQWAFADVIEVVTRAGSRIDAVVLPKVASPAHIHWLDLLLGQVEQASGLPPGRIAIEAQIEDAAGLEAAGRIAAASPRLTTLIVGPADLMASLGMRSLRIGVPPPGYPGDALHYPLLRVLVAARSAGLQAIDGPYAAIGDLDGLRAAAVSAAALGFDGKWVVHPDQVEVVNSAFRPGQEEYERAEAILEAYEHASAVRRRGAVMFGGEMIDEASRRLAQAIAARGRAAGLARHGGG